MIFERKKELDGQMAYDDMRIMAAWLAERRQRASRAVATATAIGTWKSGAGYLVGAVAGGAASAGG